MDDINAMIEYFSVNLTIIIVKISKNLSE